MSWVPRFCLTKEGKAVIEEIQPGLFPPDCKLIGTGHPTIFEPGRNEITATHFLKEKLLTTISNSFSTFGSSPFINQRLIIALSL